MFQYGVAIHFLLRILICMWQTRTTLILGNHFHVEKPLLFLEQGNKTQFFNLSTPFLKTNTVTLDNLPFLDSGFPNRYSGESLSNTLQCNKMLRYRVFRDRSLFKCQGWMRLRGWGLALTLTIMLILGQK